MRTSRKNTDNIIYLSLYNDYDEKIAELEITSVRVHFSVPSFFLLGDEFGMFSNMVVRARMMQSLLNAGMKASNIPSESKRLRRLIANGG